MEKEIFGTFLVRIPEIQGSETILDSKNWNTNAPLFRRDWEPCIAKYPRFSNFYGSGLEFSEFPVFTKE